MNNGTSEAQAAAMRSTARSNASEDTLTQAKRELLQADSEVEAMRAALTKRVLELLGKLAKDEPGKYQGFWREFGTVLKEGLAEDPGLATLHRNHGDLLLEAGDQGAALEAYQRAVRHHETLGPEVWARIGALRAAAGDDEEARNALEHALLLDPAHVEARARLNVLRGAG